MATPAYLQVDEEGFTGFLSNLGAEVWGEITVPKGKHSLLDLPTAVLWKLRLQTAIQVVVDGVGQTSPLDLLDAEWDRVQRAFDARVRLAESDESAAVRDAGALVRTHFLRGSGTAQTGYAFGKEVDFGRHQAELAKRKDLAAALSAIGATAVIGTITKATDALAEGLKKAKSDGVDTSPSRRRMLAHRMCGAAFRSVHEQLDAVIDHPNALDGDVKRATELRKPLLALLERYANAAPAAPEASTPVAPATTPTHN